MSIRRTIKLSTLWATLMETTHTLPQKNTRHTKLTVTPKFISSNGKQDFR